MSNKDWTIIGMVLVVVIAAVAIYGEFPSRSRDHPPADQRRWIRTQEAAIHERGNRASPVIATLNHGTQVRIWETAEKWKKISAPRTDDDPHESLIGWVCDIHLASMEMERVVEAYEDPYLCEASIADGWVDVPVANLRSGPGSDHSIVGKAKASQYADIHEQREGWARVSIPMVKADGKVLAGWIRGDLIRGTYVAGTDPKRFRFRDDCQLFYRRIGDGAPSVWPTTLLNVREGPGKNYAVIANLPLGHVGLVDQKCGDWVEIHSDRSVGRRIEYFAGWIYFPLTCTTSAEIRGVRYARRNMPNAVRRIIAPECPPEVNARARYLISHPYEN